MTIGRLWIMTAALAMASVARAEFRPADTPSRTRTLRSFPPVIEQWQGSDAPRFDARTLELLGADDYVNRIYRAGSRAMSLYVGYYRSQSQGDQIHSPLNCLPGAGWEPLERTRVTLNIEASSTLPGTFGPISVNRLTVQKGEDRQLVLYWYQTRHRIIASEYWNKFYLVADAFSTNRTDAALVRIISPLARDGDGDSDTTREAVAFAKTVLPTVNLWLFQ
jgi:EpsI family protein